MKGREILLIVTGGIAAYKSAELLRRFVKAGARVQVVMTEAASRFVSPLTFETLSGRPVQIEMFAARRGKVEHIELSASAELLVVAPATADFLARAATGRASDLAAAVTLAFRGPVLAAPAMNTNMWENPLTRDNLRRLEDLCGWRWVLPGVGELACGTSGAGRMAEPGEIFDVATTLLGARDLDGQRWLVTAGPTIEDLDPVRFVSNRSSGKMGYAVARAAHRRGATVTLVSGPTSLPVPTGIDFVPIRSALELADAVAARAADQEVVVMAAAVADFRPAEVSPTKLKKLAGEDERVVRFVRNPDILAALGRRFGAGRRPFLVGFCVESGDLESAARAKLSQKGCHLVVGNLADDSLGRDDNQVLVVGADMPTAVSPRRSKDELADWLLDLVSGQRAEASPPHAPETTIT